MRCDVMFIGSSELGFGFCPELPRRIVNWSRLLVERCSERWKVIYFPSTQVVHIGGESAQTVDALSKSGRQISALQLESELLYFRKHFGFLGLSRGALLFLLADILSCGKGILGGFDFSKIRNAAKHAKLLVTLLMSTKFGTQPTR